MIVIDKRKKNALYVQIYSQIKDEIISKTLKENDILAGSRSLAKTLNVSRNTVDNAYSQLEAEGYITSVKGVGYKVEFLPELFILNKTRKNINAINSCKLKQTSLNKKKFSNADFINIKTSSSTNNKSQSKIIYDLTNGSHTNDLFPKALWKKYTLECLS